MSHTGNAPFGFEWKNGALSVVEEEAKTRRLAFEFYAELRNKAAVAKRLNELGHKTRRGNGWRDVTVTRTSGNSSNVRTSSRQNFGKKFRPPWRMRPPLLRQSPLRPMRSRASSFVGVEGE